MKCIFVLFAAAAAAVLGISFVFSRIEIFVAVDFWVGVRLRLEILIKKTYVAACICFSLQRAEVANVTIQLQERNAQKALITEVN